MSDKIYITGRVYDSNSCPFDMGVHTVEYRIPQTTNGTYKYEVVCVKCGQIIEAVKE